MIGKMLHRIPVTIKSIIPPAIFTLIAHTGCSPSDAASPGLPNRVPSRPDGAIRLTTPPSGVSDQNPAFSPDGQTILFTRFHQGYNDGPAGLYLLSFGGGEPVVLLYEEDQDSVNLPGAAWVALSPPGSEGRITFSSDRQDTDEIWTMAGDGAGLFRVTQHVTASYFIEPSFSPDGQWIVFEVDPDAPENQQQGSLYKVRADGAELTALTDGPAGGTDDRQPNWSPAGDRILFQRRAPGSDDWNLYTLATDGSDVQQVTAAPSSDTDASWSPTGGCIVYSSDHGELSEANIHVISATNGVPIRVTYNSTYDGAPSWSPDGSWIAFESAGSQIEESPSALWRIAVPEGACAARAHVYLPLITNQRQAHVINVQTMFLTRSNDSSRC